MADILKSGLSAETEFVVKDAHLANIVGSGMVSVFSTAMMIAGMEAAAVKAVQPALGEGQTTVGVHVDVWHRAPTPAGMKVYFKATLESISADGRKLFYRLEAKDELGLIGEGVHQRVVIDKARFEAKAEAKNSVR